MIDPVPSKDLLPCPFCGKDAKVYGVNLVGCVDTVGCGAQVDWGHFYGPDPVIAAWNKRAAGVEEIEHLRRENVRWENAHKILLSENERLRKQVGELSVHAEKWVKRALGGDRASVFANAATDSETFVVTAGQVTHYEQPAPEPCAIRWSAVQKPNGECGYTHLIGDTPFGRILITWKGWKETHDMMLDESPWGQSAYVGSTVEAAKATVEAEFNKRLALCRATQPPPVEHPNSVNIVGIIRPPGDG